MRRNMSENLGLYKYLWPGSVCNMYLPKFFQYGTLHKEHCVRFTIERPTHLAVPDAIPLNCDVEGI